MRRRALLIALALAVCSCARELDSPPVERAEIRRETDAAAEDAFGALFTVYARVLAISERLRLANLELCADHSGGYFGWMVFAGRDFGSQEMRALAASVVQVGEVPVVVALSPEGPATRAGLQIGDEIMSVGSKRTRTHVQVRRAEQGQSSERATVRFRRAGEEREVAVAPARACRYEAMPVYAGLGASPTRDGHVGVSIALVEEATDNELAFTLAHSFALQRLGVDVYSAVVPFPEPQTTNLAVEMCERAGFDLDDVERLLELEATEQPWGLFLPAKGGGERVGELPKRIVALRAALARRAAK